ncbi:fluoride efflux transporter FluC [Paenibacillus flagellatus]|nr:CrcB family protein [Paenibacillus flagellatus]
MTYLFVGLAGIGGALLRFAIGAAFEPFVPPALFPAATLFCNWTGSFALGWMLGGGLARTSLSERARTAMATGFVGSYTTFSTFSAETVRFIDGGQGWLAVVYIVTSMWGGIALAWAGDRLAAARSDGGETA